MGRPPSEQRGAHHNRHSDRPNHLALEVVGNAVYEAAAGHTDRIDVVLHENGSLSVTDNGRGTPFEWNKKE